MSKPDGYLVQQRRRDSDDEWGIDVTEYPLEDAGAARRRLSDLDATCPEVEWRAVTFRLGKRAVRAAR